MSDIRIQDDLYRYVNDEWIAQAVIPSDKPLTGGFAVLEEDLEKLLLQEFNDMVKKDEYPNDYLKKACLLYQIALNTKKRNRDGIKPALKKLNKILKLKNYANLNRNLKELILDDYNLPFSLEIIEDMKNTDKYALYVGAPRTILPDSAYYKPGMEQQKEMMFQLWKGMATGALSQTNLTPEEQALFLEDTIKFDAVIASLVKTREELTEYTKLYNPMTLRRVSTLLKPLKFKKLVLDTFGQEIDEIIVQDVKFLKGFKEVLREDNFEEFKHWSYVMNLLDYLQFLSEDLRFLGGTFMRALTGVQEMESAEKFSYNLAQHLYSEPVGIYYGKKYFGEEAKADVTEMVYEILNKYKERVKKNEILTEETKKKAIAKLDVTIVSMGYPDKVSEIYNKLDFDPKDNLLNICFRLKRITIEDLIENFFKPVNKEKWDMPGHMVNACFNPFKNSITFPAAILQAPFYSIKQTRSQNLGGIGAVIGHEISHSFDNNGSKFDEKGNLANWWTKEDFKKFEKKTKDMVKQFEGITLPWGTVNPQLTVSENIADNGGVAVTLDIMHDTKDANFEEYFMNWARIWRMKANEGYLQLLLQLDEHGPNYLRANMPPRNFPEWYETFKVTKKDQMYIAPNKRVVIW